jgi:hypothetical protein
LNKVPREDVFMTIVYWWGVPSELEMELFCRGLFPSDGNRITLEERWRGTLLPVLAGGDPRLLEELCSRSAADSKPLKQILSDYCLRQGWQDYPRKGFSRAVSNLVPTFPDEPALVPPASAIGLWASGLLVYSPERGRHVHPAYLCSDDARWLHFFEWQAQQRAYFGLMEQGRFALCRNITESLGKGWASAITPNDPKEEQRIQKSDIYCGWGHLGRLLRQPQLAGFQNWIGAAMEGIGLRNRLAHTEAAIIDDFRRYQKELAKPLSQEALRQGAEKKKASGA